MKVQIIYSSLSGCTKKVAEEIFNNINLSDKSIYDLKDGEPILDGDIILLGYWVDKGGPNEEMKNFMSKIKDKAIGVFCTLGYYADSAHAKNSIETGINLLKDNNIIIGSYVCNGALSQNIIDNMRKSKGTGHHSVTPQKELRWDIMKNHPTKAECELASERFNERITLYTKCMEQNLEFTSIL